MSLENSTKKLFDDNEQDESEQELGEDENKCSTYVHYYKKGDVENASIYRPICSLPALYKLFSTILYGR